MAVRLSRLFLSLHCILIVKHHFILRTANVVKRRPFFLLSLPQHFKEVPKPSQSTANRLAQFVGSCSEFSNYY